MIFQEKHIILKDASEAILKTPGIEDAGKQLACIKATTLESDYLSRTIDDWIAFSEEDEEKWIRNVRESQNTTVISCYINNEIAGTCDITFKTGSKSFHRATVGIAIQKKYRNNGIGTAMFSELIRIAEEHNSTEIVDLEMIEGNIRAQALYEKFGFETICIKAKYFKLKDGTYQNLVYMQKYLKRV